MKLTEQQLANMFQKINDKEVENEHAIGDLYASVEASEKRLTDVEKIANNSTISASYQIINQLKDWSQAVGTEIQLSLKPKFTTAVFAWFKPTVATAALVTAVYFVTPNINSELGINHSQNNTQQKSDQIMFTTSFEGNDDVIKTLSFDQPSQSEKTDTILKSNFS